MAEAAVPVAAWRTGQLAAPPTDLLPIDAHVTIRRVSDTIPNEHKLACLETLTLDRLRALHDAFDLDGSHGGSHGSLAASLGQAPFQDILRALKAPELAACCVTLGLHPKGKKADLIKRLLEGKGARIASGRVEPDGSDAASARGGLKLALRRFALDSAAGFRGRDAATNLVKALLAAFGWTEGEPPGVAIPATLTVVEHAARSTRTVAALWTERRVLIDVVAAETPLASAWTDILRSCLQLTPTPEYVVLTNQREIHLYDVARDRLAPRLAIAIDDLAKHSEAFVFLGRDWVPGTTARIVNVGKVSREVADLVAKVYRSLRSKHAERGADVTQFTLQCIVTMFAEDIGLLPRDHFTELLYEGARHRDVEERLRALFELMATKDVAGPRKVAYFNGGLFANPVTVPLDEAELAALTKATEANWKYVDPHIFGSVFQGIMDDAERHASGAHYTAHEDIMRVVGPTIVEPWLARIAAAKTLAQLQDVRRDLARFRVLDPACGSGNFLYVAFRELYALETQLLARIHREFPSAKEVGWSSAISTLNFYGIDTNSFAVALARVTLNIAKKIAFEERRQKAADAAGQAALEIDPSLPLDNLDKNIVCADALFTKWPEVDAIIGNPPILGDRKIRSELGTEYLERLRDASGLDGIVDLSCHWFRRAHDRLPAGGRAGLVGTSGIRVGKARAATLDYIVANGGTITNAVSSVLWPGEAALNVSMVNWVKGAIVGPHKLTVEGVTHELARIATHLQLHADVSEAGDIRANESGTSMGVIFGHEAFRSSGAKGFSLSAVARENYVRPVATGDGMLRGKLSTQPEYCIHLGAFGTEATARASGGTAFEHLEEHVYPFVMERAASEDTHHFARWLRTWWQPREPGHAFFRALASRTRFIACANPQARPIYAFLSSTFVPTNTMQVFAFDDDYSFGIIQSRAHWDWVIAQGGKVTERKRYTNKVWSTFPWPQEVSDAAVTRVAAAGRALRTTRTQLMDANGWSLRALYQAAEVDGPHPLKDAQHALDEAVAEAYGLPPDQETTEFLLELNQALVEDEAQGRTVTGPGLPAGFDPKDPRWLSDDCIQPPPLPE